MSGPAKERAAKKKKTAPRTKAPQAPARAARAPKKAGPVRSAQDPVADGGGAAVCGETHGSAFAAFARPPVQVLRPDGTLDPKLDPGLDDALLIRMFRTMSLMRVLDERMLGMQRQGRIGFYGASSGQEAAVIGTAAALNDDDWIFPALREGGVMLWRGYPLEPYLAQILGNGLDPAKARQMPSHMSDVRVHQVSWSSCIGSQLPQATGAAWAAKHLGDSRLAVGFMGDGGTSSADFHVALNFAAVMRAPAIFVCQNNGWGISTPTKGQTASATIAQKALAYGMPGLRIDGNDVVAVFAAVKWGATHARRGDGPCFIEAVTYRLGAHSSSDDPTRYRDDGEVAHWRRLDPLIRLGLLLDARGLVSPTRQEAQRAELDSLVREALANVEGAPPPPRETLFDDVFAELTPHLLEQRAELLARAPAAPIHPPGNS